MDRSRIFKRFGLVAFLILGIHFPCFAQANYSTSELDTLVANIALYPDPLLVQVLDASTYGNQIPAAALWADAHKNMKGEALASAIEEANLPYDPSVQALLPFPSVLSMMSKYRTWTDQLGDAVTNQKDEVMEAVQRMRQKAYDYGHLKTNEQVKVETGDNITIYTPVWSTTCVTTAIPACTMVRAFGLGLGSASGAGAPAGLIGARG